MTLSMTPVRLALLAFTAIASACVYAPEPGSLLPGSGKDSTFSGFASASGATVQVQVLNKATSSWEVLATTTADSTPINYGGYTVYSWSVSAAVYDNSVPATLCRLSASCTHTAGGDNVAIRVAEVGGSISELLILKPGGLACVTSEVSSGANLVTASVTCADSNSPILWLHNLG